MTSQKYAHQTSGIKCRVTLQAAVYAVVVSAVTNEYRNVKRCADVSLKLAAAINARVINLNYLIFVGNLKMSHL